MCSSPVWLCFTQLGLFGFFPPFLVFFNATRWFCTCAHRFSTLVSYCMNLYPGSHFKLVAAVNLIVSSTGEEVASVQTHFLLKKLFRHHRVLFFLTVRYHTMQPVKTGSPSLHTCPHPSCVSPPAGFNIHTSFVFLFCFLCEIITRVNSSPFHSSSSYPL